MQSLTAEERVRRGTRVNNSPKTGENVEDLNNQVQLSSLITVSAQEFIFE